MQELQQPGQLMQRHLVLIPRPAMKALEHSEKPMLDAKTLQIVMQQWDQPKRPGIQMIDIGDGRPFFPCATPACPGRIAAFSIHSCSGVGQT
jgi:hypothetical protein